MSAPSMSADELARLHDRARAEDDPGVLAAAIPYAQFLGLELARGPAGPVARMRYDEHLIGDSSIPALHGGTIAALLESCALFQVMWSSPVTIVPKTITFTIDYLRSGRPIDTHARASIVRAGRRIVVLSVSAYQDDEAKPIATAIVHVLASDD